MEVSKAFQADIRHIQNQLKIAILNHQVMVKKKNEDPTNIHIQVQLRDVQRHIISLGEIQKQLIQRLRKELEANSTNSTLNNRTPNRNAEEDNDVEIIQTSSNNSASSTGSTSSNINSKKSFTTLPDGTSKVQNGIIHSGVTENSGNGTAEQIRLPGAVSRNSSSSSEDDQEIHEPLAEDITHEKLAFLRAVGLITREILSDLQNRRVERKRRSTANHTQFVYGSNWEVSKRKKYGYLLSTTSPQTKTRRKPQTYQKQQQQQKDKQQMAFSENDAPVKSLTSTVEKMPSVSSSSVSQACSTQPVITDKINTSAFRISSKPVSRSLLRTSGTGLPKTSLRLASLPASLTIERVNSPPHVCIICSSSGMLSMCKSCNVNFHPSCSKEASCCPKCNMDQGSSYMETKQGPNEPSNGLVIQQTIVPLQTDLSGPGITKEGTASIRRNYTKEDTADQ